MRVEGAHQAERWGSVLHTAHVFVPEDTSKASLAKFLMDKTWCEGGAGAGGWYVQGRGGEGRGVECLTRPAWQSYFGAVGGWGQRECEGGQGIVGKQGRETSWAGGQGRPGEHLVEENWCKVREGRSTGAVRAGTEGAAGLNSKGQRPCLTCARLTCSGLTGTGLA